MRAKIFGTWTRIAVIAAALALSLASATQPKRGPGVAPTPDPAPQPRAMNPDAALGVWRSSFGMVKIERDSSRGGEALMGVWVYQRQGQDVVGFFSGTLRGNILDFTWHEPAQPADLTGAGYLAFDPQGGSFSGQWWTNARDRNGEWTGWRDAQPQAAPAGYPPVPPPQTGGYGGQSYGGQGYGQPEGQPQDGQTQDDGTPGAAPPPPDDGEPPPVDYDPSTDPFHTQKAPPPP